MSWRGCGGKFRNHGLHSFGLHIHRSVFKIYDIWFGNLNLKKHSRRVQCHFSSFESWVEMWIIKSGNFKTTILTLPSQSSSLPRLSNGKHGPCPLVEIGPNAACWVLAHWPSFWEFPSPLSRKSWAMCSNKKQISSTCTEGSGLHRTPFYWGQWGHLSQIILEFKNLYQLHLGSLYPVQPFWAIQMSEDVAKGVGCGY